MKRRLIYCGLLVILIGIGSVILWSNNHTKAQNQMDHSSEDEQIDVAKAVEQAIYGTEKEEELDGIVVSSWDGMAPKYSLGTCDEIADASVNIDERHTFFYTNEEFQTLFADNKDYLKTGNFYYGWDEREAKWFYHDNNYYVVYKNDDDEYIARNLCTRYDYNGNRCTLPTPFYISLEKDVVEAYENGEFPNSIEETVFGKCTFEEAKEYYARLDDSLYEIDEANKTISVAAYDPKLHDKIYNCVRFDYKNRKIFGKDKDGNEIQIYPSK